MLRLSAESWHQVIPSDDPALILNTISWPWGSAAHIKSLISSDRLEPRTTPLCHFIEFSRTIFWYGNAEIQPPYKANYWGCSIAVPLGPLSSSILSVVPNWCDNQYPRNRLQELQRRDKNSKKLTFIYQWAHMESISRAVQDSWYIHF